MRDLRMDGLGENHGSGWGGGQRGGGYRWDLQSDVEVGFKVRGRLGLIIIELRPLIAMCFLKNIGQKPSRPLSSAFKKVEIEHTETTQSSEEDLRQSDSKFKDNSETSDMAPSSELSEVQKLQIHFLMDILQTNNSVAWSLVERNQEMEKTIGKLTSELQKLKKQLGEASSKKLLPNIPLDNSDSGDRLLLNLFGEKDYKYKMVLAEPLSHQLYKQRNFDLKINIIDSQDNLILNSNPIPISLCLYTSDQPNPTAIHCNKLGQPILKGNSESELFHGSAEFRKIHLRQVSSYYANGWVSIVVYPKAPSFTYNAKESTLQQMISYQLVKPLAITDVVVRAKKK